LAGYYRHFIHNYGAITASLTKLLLKDGFKWSVEVADAFRALQHALTTVLVLQLLAFDKEFIVEFDASCSRFNTVVHQGDGVVAFFDRPIARRMPNW
jgi:hypothetical protein